MNKISKHSNCMNLSVQENRKIQNLIEKEKGNHVRFKILRYVSLIQVIILNKLSHYVLVLYNCGYLKGLTTRVGLNQILAYVIFKINCVVPFH